MDRFKNFLGLILSGLVLVAGVGLYVGARDLMDLPSGYIDCGSYMFTAQRYDRSSRQVTRRIHHRQVKTTETVYLVRCVAPDAPCHYTIRASTESEAKRLVGEPFQTQRRVFQEKGGDGGYLTAGPGETAESYLRGRQLKGWVMIALSLAYLLGFGLYWFLRAKREASLSAGKG